MTDTADTTPTGAPGVPITVYWRPGCWFCSRLRRKLRAAGVDAVEVDIWQDDDAAAFVRSVAGGNETVPTVRVGEVALVNPSVEAILAAAERQSA